MYRSLANIWSANAVADLPLPANSFIIYSESEADDRANVRYWRERCDQRDPQSFAVVLEALTKPANLFRLSFDGRELDVSAFDLQGLVNLVPRGSNLVVDISGVDHMFWAGCMVEFRSQVAGLYFIYTEPGTYRFAVRPPTIEDFETGLFDLSDRSLGVSPLPRFANLHGPELYGGRSVFVPLLGFEGRRALNVLSGLDPAPSNVIPIIGVPGYRLEFPSYTAICNDVFFADTRSEAKIRFAPANDPFRVREVLHDIGDDFPDSYMYISPIGTRPHTVGALMFADKERERAEILFDHPVRKSASRQGTGNAHLYRIF